MVFMRDVVLLIGSEKIRTPEMLRFDEVVSE